MSGDKNKKLLSPNPEIRRQSGHSGDAQPKRQSHGTKRPTVRKSEDVNFFKACAKVLNRLGDDVTPKPLTDLLMKRYGPGTQIGDPGSLNQLSSDYLLSQGSFLQSSYSVFGGARARSSASHMVTTQSGSYFDDIYDQAVEQPLLIKDLTTTLEALDTTAKWTATEADRRALVEINLTETEIFWLVDIAGDTASSEGEDADIVRSSNETYMELLKNRPGNERYIVKGMGTISKPLKTKGVQTSDTNFANKSVGASWSSIYDTTGPFLDKEETEEKLNAEVVQLIDQQVVKASEDAPRSSLGLEAAEKPADEEHSSVEALTPQRKTVIAMDEDSTVSIADVQATAGPVKAAADDLKIFQSESFKKSLFVMERVVNLNTYHKILTSYRGLPWLSEEPPEVVEAEEEQSEDLDLGPSLNRLWTYRCTVTKGHNVSCIGFNKANPDLLAVGYCQFEYTKQKPGLICCWSVKNPEFPERIYHTAEGVTSVSFCIKQPCLLAVGLYDGVIAIYNVSTRSKESILDTLYGVPARHIGPVWDLQWILRNRDGEGTDYSSNEMLMSVSLDGLVKQWAIRQGFECKDMLKLMRVPAKHTSERKVKKGGTDIVTSKYDGGLCFDFSPFDGDMYLVGTEAGYIHRCSCLYTEQSLDIYAGHTGPVYKVRWSPFDENVFISCSGDYSVRLWHQTRMHPVLTISSAMKPVHDVRWSPRNSTVVAFVHEGAIEIWDLTENTLDPVIVHSSSTPDVKLSTIAFAVDTDCLLVGDSEGQVVIYQVPDTLLHRDNQAEAILNVIKLALRD